MTFPPYFPPPDVPGGTGHEEIGWPWQLRNDHGWPSHCVSCGRPLGARWWTETRKLPSGIAISAARHYTCPPASALPLLALVFLVAFLASVLTLALSAAASATPRRALVADVAAVRAEEPARASMLFAPAEGVAPRDDLPVPIGSSHVTTQPPVAILAIIRSAALEFHQDPARLEAVARCESGPQIDVNAIGDGGLALGPMQFHARTFMWLSKISGLGYELRHVADPEAQFRLSAWAFANGWAHLWTCAR